MAYTPEQLAKACNEDSHQKAIFAWCNMAIYRGFAAADDSFSYTEPGYASRYNSPEPLLKWIHHIPNGGARGDDVRSNKIRGAKLKAEGVKSGVSDIFLPVKSKDFSGLYIELKVGKNTASDKQLEFGEFVKSQNYDFHVVWGWKNAVNLIKVYINSCK